jgi:hypothetical protein
LSLLSFSLMQIDVPKALIELMVAVPRLGCGAFPTAMDSDVMGSINSLCAKLRMINGAFLKLDEQKAQIELTNHRQMTRCPSRQSNLSRRRGHQGRCHERRHWLISETIQGRYLSNEV